MTKTPPARRTGRPRTPTATTAAKPHQPAAPAPASDVARRAPEPVAAAASPGATPLVRKVAAEHNIDLATLTGTGAGGRITLADVRAAIPPRPQRVAAAAAPTPRPAKSEIITKRSEWDDTKSVQVDLYAVNPLVDDARQALPAIVKIALTEAPLPTLFSVDDLPVYLTSGADPSILLNLPWMVRHAAAAASPGELNHLLEVYTGAGAVMAELDFADHTANQDYRARVFNWLRGANTADRLGAIDTRVRQAANVVYQGMYGAKEAHDAASRAARTGRPPA